MMSFPHFMVLHCLDCWFKRTLDMNMPFHIDLSLVEYLAYCLLFLNLFNLLCTRDVLVTRLFICYSYGAGKQIYKDYGVPCEAVLVIILRSEAFSATSCAIDCVNWVCDCINWACDCVNWMCDCVNWVCDCVNWTFDCVNCSSKRIMALVFV
jgi:hypothetical protein